MNIILYVAMYLPMHHTMSEHQLPLTITNPQPSTACHLSEYKYNFIKKQCEN